MKENYLVGRQKRCYFQPHCSNLKTVNQLLLALRVLDMAIMEDKRSGAKVEMELRFGEDGLISSVYGMRLFLDEDMVVVKAWEIRILWIANSDPMIQSTISELDTQFEQRDTYLTTKASHDGVLVPTAIEVGWWEEDSLELCFKRTNTKSDFSILYPRWRIH
jgi:hypothetical protein